MDLKVKIALDKNLALLIGQERYSQTYLAKKLSINKSTLHGYVNGVIPQGLINVMKLSDFFNVSLEELIFESISAPKKEIKTNKQITEERYEIIIKKVID